MKKSAQSKQFHGAITLNISPGDPVAWKLSMLMEASISSNKKKTIEEIAKNYGYTREHFYIIKNIYEEQGAGGLLDKVTGPKKNYKRTKEVTKQIIRFRFLDPDANSEVITQKMKQLGYDISQRSVERAINEYGLQKKGYIKQIRQMRKLK